jgi:uncharacterized protein
MIRQTQILIWRLIAVVSLALGVAGLAVPVVPTVPFLLIAAWAGGKGWPALESWLLAHPLYGSHIRNWRELGAVPREAKLLASLMMLASCIGLQFTPTPPWLRIGVPMLLFAVAVWLWTRPEP